MAKDLYTRQRPTEIEGLVADGISFTDQVTGRPVTINIRRPNANVKWAKAQIERLTDGLYEYQFVEANAPAPTD